MMNNTKNRLVIVNFCNNIAKGIVKAVPFLL